MCLKWRKADLEKKRILFFVNYHNLKVISCKNKINEEIIVSKGSGKTYCKNWKKNEISKKESM